MPTPKSSTKTIVKSGKSEVIYESNLDATQYYIYELTRAALRDVGKFVTKTFKAAYYSHFSKISGNAGKATKYKVWAGQKTTHPRIQIGLKTGPVPGFYAYFQEFGTSTGIPRLGLLTHAVEDNVAEIVKIESQYLSGLSDEAARLESLIDESDMEGDADD
jgi:hypothetical protein